MYRLNPNLREFLQSPAFWVRESFCAPMAVVGLVAVDRVARPGAPLGRIPAAVALPILVLWAIAAVSLWGASPSGRVQLLIGGTAARCPFVIGLLAMPQFVALMWILRQYAPVRLRLAGTYAGLAAGALGALIYSLQCPELAAPFVGVWYLLRMLMTAAIGAWRGPRLWRRLATFTHDLQQYFESRSSLILVCVDSLVHSIRIAAAPRC